MHDNKINRFFTGVVSSSDAGTYNVSIDPTDGGNAAIIQGIPLSSILANTLGFKECPPYTVGSSVLCMTVSGERCYIIGIIPDADIGNVGFYNRALLKTFDHVFDKQNTQGYDKEAIKLLTHNNNRPTDVSEGEYAIGNEFGVMLGLFQQLALLKGSELAQIQCYFIDDLVRIVSHNFQHWSALGELNISHDGKAIIAELGATHLSSESIGIPSVSTTPATEKMFAAGDKPEDGTDEKDYYDFTDNEKSKAIERLKVFVGRLGDFLRLFLVKPAGEKRTLDGTIPTTFDTGLLDCHVGTDGRFSLRSTTGVIIEKTNWIRVPHRVRAPEDPLGDDGEEVEYPVKDPFVFDNQFNYQSNPVAYFLQLRDCLSYLQDNYSYKNFDTLTKDFGISKNSADKETPLSEVAQIDPNTKVDYPNYQLRKSGIYLTDNGGIVFRDAWDSAIIMEGGKIYLQPATDLVAQPLRHLIAKVGHSTSICSKQNIDISSTEAGFRLKTDAQQHLYSRNAGILLQSDAIAFSGPTPTGEAYTGGSGIQLLAKDSGIVACGDKVLTKSTNTTLFHSTGSMNIESVGSSVNILADQDLYLLTKGNMTAYSQNNISVIADSSLSMAGSSQTSLGNEGSPINVVPAKDSLPVSLEGVIPVSTFTSGLDSTISTLEENLLAGFTPFDDESAIADIKFRFLSSDKYALDPLADFLPMTMSQQSAVLKGDALTEWIEDAIEETYPFPGQEQFNDFYLKANINNSQKVGNDLVSKSIDSMQNTAKLEKAGLQEYKVFNS